MTLYAPYYSPKSNSSGWKWKESSNNYGASIVDTIAPVTVPDIRAIAIVTPIAANWYCHYVIGVRGTPIGLPVASIYYNI